MLDIQHHKLLIDGVSFHYVTAGSGPPLLLLHGFPQTWHQWRQVIERLAPRFTIIAPDLRGIGSSPGPVSGYDKYTMAGDVRGILAHVCGDMPAIIVGHDMGSFVAFGYALRFPALVSGLVLIDAAPPGTDLFEQVRLRPRAWHIAFHSSRDVAEMLVAGRERAYIAQFILARIYNPSAISEQDIDLYAAAYAAPGALRAAFAMYATLAEEDTAANRAALAQGKLEMPVLAIGGSDSLTGPMLDVMLNEITLNGKSISIPKSGHWVSEEQPDAVAHAIAVFANEVLGR